MGRSDPSAIGRIVIVGGSPFVSQASTMETMKMTTVEEFIDQKVQPEHREIVDRLRKLMHDVAPNAEEVITYGILGWRGNLMLAVVSPTKKDITFAFSRGAEFEYKYGLLKGVGKKSKHVKIKNVQEINQEALEYYIKQALELDAK
jgi:hypothetical protein